jgi:hypothetical protein
MDDRTGWTRRSRRATLRAGGGLLAAFGATALPGIARAQATPTAGDAAASLLLVQAFSTGSLFPTQGDAEGPPFTLILWDAADRGLFSIAAADHIARLVPTESLIIAVEAGERPRAAVIVPAAADGSRPEHAWALELASAGLGSDPGAVTYQGEVLPEDEATAWLGVAPAATPDGPQELTAGYLVIAGLPGLDLPDEARVQLDLT